MKTPRESLEHLKDKTDWTFTLRYCDYDSQYQYPKLLETDDVTEVIEYIENNYTDTYSLDSGSTFRRNYITQKLPYLHLIMTPSGRHSYIKEYSTQKIN